jgi:hypothetical protein
MSPWRFEGPPRSSRLVLTQVNASFTGVLRNPRDFHWHLDGPAEGLLVGHAHGEQSSESSEGPVIANAAFARSGGASRGLARPAGLATGLRWHLHFRKTVFSATWASSVVVAWAWATSKSGLRVSV